MKLRKCPSCKKYTLRETCSLCSTKTSIAHYKFLVSKKRVNQG
ncbi:MAG: nucleolar RNA-binding Nop10p family protein [Candidatus Pacearchaeota archaeon]